MKIKKNYLVSTLIILLLCLIVATILLGSVPPVDRDALTHHLYVPKLYIQHGGIYEIPDISFSYYPMNIDLLYAIPLYFGNDILPKYIHFFFALLTAWLVYSYLLPRTSRIYALLGSFFLLSIPVIIKLSITVYVDLGLMFFSTASLLLIFRWLQSTEKIRYLIWAGICCGLAAGTKYNGLVTVIILVLILPLFYIRSKHRSPGTDIKSIGYCLIFLLITLVTFSPWLARNYIWTGNPIYPLHNSLFQPQQNLETTEQDKNVDENENSPNFASNIIISRINIYKETWIQAILLPIRMFFEGQDDSHQFFDGKLNPFLLFLPIIAFIRPAPSHRIRYEKQALLIFSILFFFFTFFQQVPRVRYIICIIPPLVILSIFGLQNIFSIISGMKSLYLKKFLWFCALIIPFAFLGYNIEYLAQQYHNIQPLAYLSGKINRDQYITYFRPEYPAIQFVNNSPQATKTLALFLGNRGYYFDKPVQFDLKEGKSQLCEMIKQTKTNKEVSERLKNQNISHLVIRYDLFEQWIQQQLTLDEIKRTNLFFQNQAKQAFEINGHGVYELKNENK